MFFLINGDVMKCSLFGKELSRYDERCKNCGQPNQYYIENNIVEEKDFYKVFWLEWLFFIGVVAVTILAIYINIKGW